MSSTSSRKAQEPANFQLTDSEIKSLSSHRRINWTLVWGFLFVGIITTFALIGPYIAPKDPLEEALIIKIGEEWQVPPFRLFTPGYPLGSDQFGRDLWSRLLWGIKPTLQMVIIVAVVRLFLGILIGLLAGWSSSRFGRFLDSMIEAAISVPVLLVALCVIAILPVELMIWPFILGLSLTGWVETAQQVREQTRIIKNQTFVEAARALGATRPQILIGHILRQILPMLLMLFAFEISNTLMITAGLGFLGYYVGGDVWIDVSDFVAQRVSGAPELGQMLATSWTTLTEPWAMVSVGSTIFLTVLGFNLIGEGLRTGLSVGMVRRTGFVAQIRHTIVFWFDQYIFYPIHQVFMRPVFRFLLITILAAAIFWFGGVKFLWPHLQTLSASPPVDIENILASIRETPTPTGGSHGENSATNEAPDITERSMIEPQVVIEKKHAAAFATGLVLDPSREVMYAADVDRQLAAFTLDGGEIWTADMPEVAAESLPVLDVNGNVYVMDKKGGLSAYTPEGELLWHFVSQVAQISVSGPLLSPDEILYYVVTDYTQGFVQAVSLNGEDLWAVEVTTTNFFIPLAMSIDGRYLFLRDNVIDTRTHLIVPVDTELTPLRYVGGEDGLNYLYAGPLYTVNLEATPTEIGEIFAFDSDRTNNMPFGAVQVPSEIDINKDPVARYLYTTPGGQSSLVWISPESPVLSTDLPFSSSSIQAEMDFQSVLVCGGRSFDPQFLDCALAKAGQEEPAWLMKLGSNGPGLGGFWFNDNFYFSTGSGMIYAITEVEQEAVQPSSDDVGAQLPSLAGIVWSTPIGKKINFGPLIADDGTIFLVTEDNQLIILTPEGSIRYQGPLYKEWFAFVYTSDRFSPEYTDQVYPTTNIPGLLVAISTDNTVYAINADGELVWEIPLENPLGNYPHWRFENRFYIVDKNAVLYAFDRNGLLWVYHPEIANKPANGFGVGPDGSVYYKITDSSTGFVQALNAEGEPIWSAELETDFFYDPLVINQDGSLVFVRDNIIDTRSGQLLDLEIPVYVRQFIMGDDGKSYLQSDFSIHQWQIGATGFEILQSASFEEYVPITRPPYIQVNNKSVIWVYPGTRSGMYTIWLLPDGTYVGEISVHQGEFVGYIEFDTLNINLCKTEENKIICGKYNIQTKEIDNTYTIENIPKFLPMNLSSTNDGYIYILTNDRDLMKISLGIP
jgi:peptide/nickel transport system permease protein